MLLPTQIRHQYTSVIVNKPALQAWLLAWTTGESFLSLTNPGLSSQKKEALALATLRRLRSKTTK